jgi:NAD(P)-dependent dehydrogenase (short-subunit alcohol dehydrogenase family)
VHIDLAEKRVLITGANSGLGAEMARAFAAEKAKVAINFLDRDAAANALAEEVRDGGGQAMVVKADIADAAAVEAMFARLDTAWGGIDILVNNAGIDGHPQRGWEGDPGNWARVIDINLKGTYFCSRQALQRMVARRAGVILNISSVHEAIAWTGYSAYAASKAGLSMMAKTFAQEAAPHGVRVLSIAPGAIKTPINRAVWSNKAGYDDLLAKIPLGRLGLPQDIARMAVVLASDLASYITGTTIFIDGGMTDYPSFAHGG